MKLAGFDAKALKDVGFELSSLIPVFDVFSLVSAGFQAQDIAKIKVAAFYVLKILVVKRLIHCQPTYVITPEAQKVAHPLAFHNQELF